MDASITGFLARAGTAGGIHFKICLRSTLLGCQILMEGGFAIATPVPSL